MDGARRGAEVERGTAHRAPLRCDAAPWSGDGPHDRPARSSAWEATATSRRSTASVTTRTSRPRSFTTPDPERVDGHVSATMPLEPFRTIIEGIRVEFKSGRAVKVDADKGADALRAVVAKDDGAARLGELALVDGEGRIGPLKTVFLDTLIDENAASHLALGQGYESPVEDEAERAREQEPRPRRLHDRKPGDRRRRDRRRRQRRPGALERRLAGLAASTRAQTVGAGRSGPTRRGRPRPPRRRSRPPSSRRDRRAAGAPRGSRARTLARRAGSCGSGSRRSGRPRDLPPR